MFSKFQVAYTPLASDPHERCELCVHFDGREGCDKVYGLILPSGWCDEFDRDKGIPTLQEMSK